MSNTRLYDIHEWRDLPFDFPGTSPERRLGVEQDAPPREICIFPFSFEEVLLHRRNETIALVRRTLYTIV